MPEGGLADRSAMKKPETPYIAQRVEIYRFRRRWAIRSKYVAFRFGARSATVIYWIYWF